MKKILSIFIKTFFTFCLFIGCSDGDDLLHESSIPPPKNTRFVKLLPSEIKIKEKNATYKIIYDDIDRLVEIQYTEEKIRHSLSIQYKNEKIDKIEYLIVGFNERIFKYIYDFTYESIGQIKVISEDTLVKEDFILQLDIKNEKLQSVKQEVKNTQLGRFDVKSFEFIYDSKNNIAVTTDFNETEQELKTHNFYYGTAKGIMSDVTTPKWIFTFLVYFVDPEIFTDKVFLSLENNIDKIDRYYKNNLDSQEFRLTETYIYPSFERSIDDIYPLFLLSDEGETFELSYKISEENK